MTTQIPGANGYCGGKVVFIDTENTLYPLQWVNKNGDILQLKTNLR